MRSKSGRSVSSEIDELHIEEIAKIENVVGYHPGFIVSDNLESSEYLSQDYLNSIGRFKVGVPCRISFTMMLFCVHGEMKLQLNLISHTLQPGEMLMVHEGTVALVLRMDPSIRLFCIGFTRQYLRLLPPSRLVNMVLERLFESPLISLSEAEMSDIFSLYKIINSRLSRSDFKFKTDMVWSGLHSIGCILLDSLSDSPTSEAILSRKQLLVKDFMHLVGNFASVERNIPFYAQKLCVSSKYLGQVVAEVTGETPRKWICRQVILEAKALLDDSFLTVQQVSETLNFPNQSFFGTFFRKHTGISPKDYRNRK